MNRFKVGDTATYTMTSYRKDNGKTTKTVRESTVEVTKVMPKSYEVKFPNGITKTSAPGLLK